MMEDRIHILTTGGTIDKIYFDTRSAFEVGEPQVAAVLRDANICVPFAVTSLMRKDSLDMTEADRLLIRQRVVSLPEQRVVITHGTDTMVQTARALGGISGKTVVLTGAMQPALFRGTDAVFNIGAAITAVQVLPEGVHIVMNGRIFDPARVHKNRENNVFEEKIE
jgi:L-asparaginase